MEGKAKNIHYGDLLVKFSEILDVTKETLPTILDEKIINKFQSAILKNGDIIIADTAEDETVGKSTEIAGISNQIVLAGLHTMPYRPLFKFSSGYLGYYMNSNSYHQQLLPLMQGIKVTSISKSAIQNTDILYPYTEDEQFKIGLLLKNVDNLITLHQRKYFYSHNLIFTITTDWEQRKLHEFADKVIEKNIGLQYLETFTNSAEFGIISQKDFFDHSISKIESLEGYYIVKNNNFVYNPRISTTAPVGPINRNKLGRTGVMSPLYTVFEANNVNCTFLEYFFRTNKWHPFMILNGDTGARSDRFSIKDDVFFEMPICKPKIDEQIKIGKYLTKFDDLITLHQRECFL